MMRATKTGSKLGGVLRVIEASAAIVAAVVLGACGGERAMHGAPSSGYSVGSGVETRGQAVVAGAIRAPDGPPRDQVREPGPSRLGVTDVTKENTAVRGFAPAGIIDTRTFPKQREDLFPGEPHRVREKLPPHEKPRADGVVVAGEPNDLRAEPTLDGPDAGRTNPTQMFATITATGWNPPDPTLAVGPNHVVVTVNSRIAFYTKAGAQTFTSALDSSGSPGFFEPLGAAGFVFDPKCVYDHFAQRFVVVALETYGTTEAWIDIAVSATSDPNGTWYKYRTDAVLTIGTSTAWWDFPGLGYDQNGYYVTGNLFGLNPASGYYGFGLRVFDKSSMLAGGTATYNTLRTASGYVVEPAIHLGATGPTTPYMVTINNSTSLTVYAVNNPLTTPTLTTTSVTTPSYTGDSGAPTINGSSLSNAGMTMPMWRNGKLYVCHNAAVGGRNVARWHELNVGTWPASGTVTRTQSGDIDAGGLNWTVFPAIGVNTLGELGVALGVTSAQTRVGAAVAGRKATDPAGRMGVPTVVKSGDADGGGRWGDYYSVAVDPTDDTTFWAIGEYQGTSGWRTWVSSFVVGTMSPCHAVPDHAGSVVAPAAALAVDVLANDWHSTGAAMTIQSFSATSARGGTIARSVGTGPGGRDRLLYTAPPGVNALDSFSYTIADASLNTATAAVTVQVLDPSTFRLPDPPAFSAAGVNVSFYDLSAAAPTTMPTYASLTPYLVTTATNINVASTAGVFANSTRIDTVGAVYDGWISVPTDNLYTLSTESDDGSKLYVGTTLLVNNDGLHGMTKKTGDIGLRAGRHHVKVEFFESGGDAGLVVRYQPLGGTEVVVPASAWTRVVVCRADFNNSGGLSIQDIFDFLNAWFAGAPGADYNQIDGLTVQDIFDYLNAWFAGC
jgi:hypothetical protein